ncbi:MAG: tetratricopeptide repeat protein [Bradymonadaceae bacterium]
MLLQKNPYALLGSALLFLLVACGSTTPTQIWSEEFLETARQAEAGAATGSEAGAEARYADLAHRAPTIERERQAEFEIARLANRQGRTAEALERFEALWSAPLKDSTGGRALYETALITANELDDREASLALHRRVIVEYPDFVASEFSLAEMKRQYTRRGEHQAFIDLLEAVHDEVAGTTVGHQVLFMRARQIQKHLGDDDRALQVYLDVHHGCIECAVGDDALWEMIQIYKARQWWNAASELLDHLARRTEASWFVGTYNSPRAGDARFELGLINLLFLEDYPAARSHFNQYLKDFPHSFHADDAAWHIVQSHRIEEDERLHQRKLERFLRDYPESRFARRATGQAR